MRLVFHVTETEIRSGKPIVLGLTGVEQLTIHFDPADETEITEPVLKFEEPKTEQESDKVVPLRPKKVYNDRSYSTGKYPCDLSHNCGKRFPTKRGLSRHKDWTKRNQEKKVG